MGPGATFWFQHYITPLDANTVSIFGATELDRGRSWPGRRRARC
jgi:hypothetical protein